MIKYNSEEEMCKDVTELISGILIPTKHKFIAEPPRSYGSNNNADMVFILENGRIFTVEYKLSDKKGLLKQIQEPFCFGVINRPINENDYYHLLSYTGLDSEIEKINDLVMGRRFCKGQSRRCAIGKTRFEDPTCNIYWWGYLNADSNINGGFKAGKRLAFHELYKEAIKNLQRKYNYKLDIELVWGMLRVYMFGTAKKYYSESMYELKEEIENANKFEEV